MPIEGEIAPSQWEWVNVQAAEYEASDGTRANTLRETGIPIIVMTTRGNKSGKVRKVPLMRVEHDGVYAIIGSKGGAPEHPGWYHNIVADPRVTIQDGPEPFDAVLRLVTGEERSGWMARGIAVYDKYEDYQEKTEREIPIFVSTRIES
jgi:deazaflavin-dependent oxidoreductase (nitroreductase family)